MCSKVGDQCQSCFTIKNLAMILTFHEIFKNQNRPPFYDAYFSIMKRRQWSAAAIPQVRCGQDAGPELSLPAAAAGVCNHHRQDDECGGWWRLAGPGRLWWDFNVSQFTPSPTTYTYLHFCLHSHHAWAVHPSTYQRGLQLLDKNNIFLQCK